MMSYLKDLGKQKLVFFKNVNVLDCKPNDLSERMTL